MVRSEIRVQSVLFQATNQQSRLLTKRVEGHVRGYSVDRQYQLHLCTSDYGGSGEVVGSGGTSCNYKMDTYRCNVQKIVFEPVR